MDNPAPAPDSHVREEVEVAIPTGRQVAVRTLPAAALVVIGVPAIVWLVVDASGQTTTRWLPVLVIALLGLSALVMHFVQAPRPSPHKRISTREVQGALSYTHRSGTVPTDPHVRTVAGVYACADVETLVMIAAFLVGGVLAALMRPEFAWLDAGILPVAMALIWAFKSRHGWAYLKVLHSISRAD
ncbi:hypothetical protein [Kocuria sabuli]|uniref:hypothetical protein n=1 Tax=Kocuria sabuli TaxID=3071448 RepID=UPI0034D40320